MLVAGLLLVGLHVALSSPVSPVRPEGEDVASPCDSLPDFGDCNTVSAASRWFYHPEDKNCMPFIFRGCGDSKNNFETLEACMKECDQDEEEEESNETEGDSSSSSSYTSSTDDPEYYDMSEEEDEEGKEAGEGELYKAGRTRDIEHVGDEDMEDYYEEDGYTPGEQESSAKHNTAQEEVKPPKTDDDVNVGGVQSKEETSGESKQENGDGVVEEEELGDQNEEQDGGMQAQQQEDEPEETQQKEDQLEESEDDTKEENINNGEEGESEDDLEERIAEEERIINSMHITDPDDIRELEEIIQNPKMEMQEIIPEFAAGEREWQDRQGVMEMIEDENEQSDEGENEKNEEGREGMNEGENGENDEAEGEVEKEVEGQEEQVQQTEGGKQEDNDKEHEETQSNNMEATRGEEKGSETGETTKVEVKTDDENINKESDQGVETTVVVDAQEDQEGAGDSEDESVDVGEGDNLENVKETVNEEKEDEEEDIGEKVEEQEKMMETLGITDPDDMREFEEIIQNPKMEMLDIIPQSESGPSEWSDRKGELYFEYPETGEGEEVDEDEFDEEVARDDVQPGERKDGEAVKDESQAMGGEEDEPMGDEKEDEPMGVEKKDEPIEAENEGLTEEMEPQEDTQMEYEYVEDASSQHPSDDEKEAFYNPHFYQDAKQLEPTMTHFRWPSHKLKEYFEWQQSSDNDVIDDQTDGKDIKKGKDETNMMPGEEEEGGDEEFEKMLEYQDQLAKQFYMADSDDMQTLDEMIQNPDMTMTDLIPDEEVDSLEDGDARGLLEIAGDMLKGKAALPLKHLSSLASLARGPLRKAGFAVSDALAESGFPFRPFPILDDRGHVEHQLNNRFSEIPAGPEDYSPREHAREAENEEMPEDDEGQTPDYPASMSRHSEDLPGCCLLPRDPGICLDAHLQWFYDPLIGTCLPFHYTGCGGNENRFDTIGDCLVKCAGIREGDSTTVGQPQHLPRPAPPPSLISFRSIVSKVVPKPFMSRPDREQGPRQAPEGGPPHMAAIRPVSIAKLPLDNSVEANIEILPPSAKGLSIKNMLKWPTLRTIFEKAFGKALPLGPTEHMSGSIVIDGLNRGPRVIEVDVPGMGWDKNSPEGKKEKFQRGGKRGGGGGRKQKGGKQKGRRKWGDEEEHWRNGREGWQVEDPRPGYARERDWEGGWEGHEGMDGRRQAAEWHDDDSHDRSGFRRKTKVFAPSMQKEYKMMSHNEDNRHTVASDPKNKVNLIQVFVNKPHMAANAQPEHHSMFIEKSSQFGRTQPMVRSHFMAADRPPPAAQMPFFQPPRVGNQPSPPHMAEKAQMGPQPQFFRKPPHAEAFRPQTHPFLSVSLPQHAPMNRGRPVPPQPHLPAPHRPVPQWWHPHPIPDHHWRQGSPSRDAPPMGNRAHKPEVSEQVRDEEVKYVIQTEEDEGGVSYACLLPVSIGFCKALKERVYFNKNTNRCETFYYGGCGGNANNFASVEECEVTCLKKSAAKPADIVTESPDVLIVTSEVYVSGEKAEEKEEKEEVQEMEKEEEPEPAREEVQPESEIESRAETDVQTVHMMPQSLFEAHKREYAIILAVIGFVALCALILVTLALVNVMRRTTRSKKERVIEAMISSHLDSVTSGRSTPKMVYYSAPPSEAGSLRSEPPKVHLKEKPDQEL